MMEKMDDGKMESGKKIVREDKEKSETWNEMETRKRDGMETMMDCAGECERLDGTSPR